MTKFEEDKIGRKEIVDKICSLVDNLTQDEYFCLALDGVWGSGKSFVLDMIKEKLNEHKEYTIIKYDAWENSFYSEPLTAILSALLEGIEDKLYLVEKRADKAKKIARTSQQTLAKLSKKIGAFNDIIEGIKKIVQILHNPVSMEELESFKTYQTLLYETKELLNEITSIKEYRGKQTKLILLVDEIDRCLPNEQLKILERLHHLFDIKNSVVIVALNMDSIAKNVNVTFGVDGKEYLRKFFDFNFKLEIYADDYLEFLLKELVEKLKKTNNDVYWDKSVISAYHALKYGNEEVLYKIDNREITRYYDTVIKICNDFGWDKIKFEYIFFILIALYMRKNLAISFLSPQEVYDNQMTLVNQSEKQERDRYFDKESPYYDYLKEYLGIDSKNLPAIITRYSLYTVHPLVQLSQQFNEIVYFSIKWEREALYYQTKRNVNDCQRLGELVRLYAGGQE